MGGGSNAGAQEAAIAQQDTNAANAIAQQMGPIISGLLGNINLPQLNQQVLGYLTNPSTSNLQQQYPQLARFFQQMMQQGLDPRVIANAINNQQVAGQQYINSLMNQLGSAVPNAAGLAKDLGLQQMQALAQLGSNLAAQNQQVRALGAQALGDISSALDSQMLQRMLSAWQGAQGAAGMGLSAYGNLFGNYLNAANAASQAAMQLQSQQPNLFGALTNVAMLFPQFREMAALTKYYNALANKPTTSP